MGEQRFIVGRRALHVKRDDVLAPDDYDAGGAAGQRQGLGPSLFLLAGIGPFLDFNFMILKEPLSFLTRHSALAVIEPVDGLSHVLILLTGINTWAGWDQSGPPTP